MKSGTKLKDDPIRRSIKLDIIRDAPFINDSNNIHRQVSEHIKSIMFNICRLTEQVKGKPHFLSDKQINSIVEMIDIHMNKIHNYDLPKISLYSDEYILSKLFNYREMALEQEIYEYVQNIDKLTKYYIVQF